MRFKKREEYSQLFFIIKIMGDQFKCSGRCIKFIWSLLILFHLSC
jgi:hypothetical protein